MLSEKYQKRIKGDDISKLDTNGKIFSRPTWYNKLCISNSLYDHHTNRYIRHTMDDIADVKSGGPSIWPKLNL